MHWDHVSGVPDFPDVPVLVSAAEHQFIGDGGFANATARSINPSRWQDIVMVPAPGHTPGSVVVFVTLPGGAHYAFVGDLAWQREGTVEREERPWLVRTALEDPRFRDAAAVA